MTNDIYTAITFAPVQGFIEKSRKLRDLYGASLILSYLSQQIVQGADKPPETKVISPGSINIQRGMPNRILIKGDFTREKARSILLTAWKDILWVCKSWIEQNLSEFDYYWEKDWLRWSNNTWEVFWGSGRGTTEAEGIIAAMEDLETRKLERDWTAINWMGESSSLTGIDGIAFPLLGSANRNPKSLTYRSEQDEIQKFYTKLAQITDNSHQENPEGKFIDPNEKLSIPELVKRLVTLDKVSQKISHQNSNFQQLPNGFQEIRRKPTAMKPGKWTGWFMGDGDKVGKKIKEIARKQGEAGIEKFTLALRQWGDNFYDYFENEIGLGRVIYAGGDDFLGVIYKSKNSNHPIQGFDAFNWLMTLGDKWQENGQDISLSVGFVWVAGSVPQRDILQHCRQAEQKAKNLKRNRVTIRVLFNSGQYVEWTCPWKYLHILKEYRDRHGNTYAQWESKDKKSQDEPNWTHVYNDLAQLKARHAFGLGENRRQRNLQNQNISDNKILDNRRDFLNFFEIYFPNWGEKLKNKELEKLLVGANDGDTPAQKALLMIDWIEDLITIGWYLCSNISLLSDP
jgi:CRISPR-associated protein Cmr2